MPAMRRWIALFLVMVLLPWQAVAWASTTLTQDDGAAERHAFAHWAGEAHHHHADDDAAPDGMHRDDSQESIQHLVHTDANLNPVAVLPLSLGWEAVVARVVDTGSYPHQRLAAPFLEGPRRPPRLSC